MMTRLAIALLAPLMLLGCVSSSPTMEPDKTLEPKILVMGDSLLAAHRISGRAISDSVARNLKEPVKDTSIVGARIIYELPITGAAGFKIGKQYRGGMYDWIIVNGGGNDLWLACGCHGCDKKLDKLISDDTTEGRIPEMIARLRNSGAQILWLGYLRSPGVNSPVESCADEGKVLETRLTQMAAKNKDMHYVSLADLVPEGDRSYHGLDMIHPSLKASAEIGAIIAERIRKVDPSR